MIFDADSYDLWLDPGIVDVTAASHLLRPCDAWVCASKGPSFLCAVLFVADMLHPLDHLAVFLFLNCDVRHGGRWRGPMPVFLFRWEPDHITRADFFDRSSPPLNPAAAGGYDESLPKRMGVPRSASTRLKSYTSTAR